jgi:hypothetical protein
MSDRIPALILAVLVTGLDIAAQAGELPDRQFTPGAINSAISEQQYRAQCHTKGWTRPYRPPVSFTNSLKNCR